MDTQLYQHDNPGRSHLAREFAEYIKGQHAAQAAGLYMNANSTVDTNDYEEPIMVRSFCYRIMRTACLRNGWTDDHNSDFVSATTAHRWAALDAMDFRNLNRIDRNLSIHCAEIICSNPSPFYQKAIQATASDVLDIAHAAIRANHARRRPQPVPASDRQGVLAIPLPKNDQRLALRLFSTQHSHQR
ncbi:hypothetical protein [Massilia sp. NR 4-1]|uniref:hypothetical protein n=1 Tax=Massilia sp. NR 4-1 TaxID=1678028 RepID=UPI00067E44AE|nr:hypothetical protein [Massilia sp. NR 4-1]AKU21213.1 hypothetical protein ACZ75_06690 [Massilia sp. NR 4-1]